MPDKQEYSLPMGTILNDKWVILEFIAKGGMGEIYRAHQLNLKRDVAIKIISEEWLNDISEDEEEKENALKRFRQEVLTMAQIRHPNVLQIYDFDTASIQKGDQAFEFEYIALEYVPGRTLRDTMREEGFYPDEKQTAQWIKKFFLPVLDGVDAIHRAGIFHRDLKPENVLMDGDIPKIADFGLARSCRLESMTCSMEIKGTPPYMAPEQFVDFKGSDQRTDIYALGKILYEAIDGKMPENAVPFTKARLKEAGSAFFRALDEIIRNATDEKSENRFRSINTLKSRLMEILDLAGQGESPERDDGQAARALLLSKNKAIVLGVAAALLAVMLTFWAYHSLREHVFQSSEEKVQNLVFPAGIPAQVSARDGSVLKLVPGGTFWVPEGVDHKGARDIKVKAFYMDETPVTNQQFVDFLNKVASEIIIDGYAVKRNGKIYLYLGQVMQGYEPIVYDNGVFRIKNTAHSACPVLRVTAYGAQAFASFHNERLPSPVEWLFAASQGHVKQSVQGSKRIIMPETFFQPLELPYPVMLMKANLFGIKGLNMNLGTWVRESLEGDKYIFAVLGGFEARKPGDFSPRPVIRNPWEAFEEVGFRCVKDVSSSPE